MANFLDQIANTVTAIVRREVPDEETTVDEFLPEAERKIVESELGFYSSVRDLIIKCRQMYDEDPRVSTTINTIARDATKNGFAVTVEGNPKAKQIIDDMLLALDFDDIIESWVKSSLKDGNLYLVAGVNDDLLITEAQKMPALTMKRHTDALDRFYEPEFAFSFNPSNSYGAINTFSTLEQQYFPQWAVVHARYNHEDNQKYGRPLFASGAKIYHYMSDGEKNMWLRRKLRSGVRYLHKIVGGVAKVREYKKVNQDALTNPATAVIDFFGNSEIEQLQGDARLSEIRDVLHMVETFAASTPLPIALIAYGMDINRDILAQKKEEYDESVGALSKWVTKQILEPLINLALLLQGFPLNSVKYTVQWTAKQDLTPERLNAIFDAALKMKALGLSNEAIIFLIAPLMPQVSLDELLKRLQQEDADAPAPTDEDEGDAAGMQRFLRIRRDIQSSTNGKRAGAIEDLMDFVREELR